MSSSSTISQEMPFLSHLAELRSCLGKSVLAIFICSLACFSVSGYFFQILTQPVQDAFTQFELVGLTPAEGFIVKIKVGLVAGALVSCPYWFFQIWRFISPGLHENEKKFALPFVSITTIIFLTGVAFCFFLILPFAFEFFFQEYESIGVAPTIRIGEYLNFVVRLIFIFGFVFELPVITYFLARFDLVTAPWLIKKFRYAIVIIFVLAAIITPPDIITQVMLALPLIILYGISIIVAKVVAKK